MVVQPPRGSEAMLLLTSRCVSAAQATTCGRPYALDVRLCKTDTMSTARVVYLNAAQYVQQNMCQVGHTIAKEEAESLILLTFHHPDQGSR